VGRWRRGAAKHEADGPPGECRSGRCVHHAILIRRGTRERTPDPGQLQKNRRLQLGTALVGPPPGRGRVSKTVVVETLSPGLLVAHFSSGHQPLGHSNPTIQKSAETKKYSLGQAFRSSGRSMEALPRGRAWSAQFSSHILP